MFDNLGLISETLANCLPAPTGTMWLTPTPPPVIRHKIFLLEQDSNNIGLTKEIHSYQGPFSSRWESFGRVCTLVSGLRLPLRISKSFLPRLLPFCLVLALKVT